MSNFELAGELVIGRIDCLGEYWPPRQPYVGFDQRRSADYEPCANNLVSQIYLQSASQAIGAILSGSQIFHEWDNVGRQVDTLAYEERLAEMVVVRNITRCLDEPAEGIDRGFSISMEIFSKGWLQLGDYHAASQTEDGTWQYGYAHLVNDGADEPSFTIERHDPEDLTVFHIDDMKREIAAVMHLQESGKEPMTNRHPYQVL